MKLKVWMAAMTVVRMNPQGVSDNPAEADEFAKRVYTTNTISLHEKEDAAKSWVDRNRSAYLKDDGSFISNIIRVDFVISYDIVDVDEWEPYQPTFEVELEVTETKYIKVTIEACDDEYDARDRAIEKFDAGDYEEDISYEAVVESRAEVVDVFEY